jgi:hypothetical protein
MRNLATAVTICADPQSPCIIDTSPHSFAWATEAVIAAANTHPSPVEILNISFLRVIDEIRPETSPMPSFALFIEKL